MVYTMIFRLLLALVLLQSLVQAIVLYQTNGPTFDCQQGFKEYRHDGQFCCNTQVEHYCYKIPSPPTSRAMIFADATDGGPPKGEVRNDDNLNKYAECIKRVPPPIYCPLNDDAHAGVKTKERHGLFCAFFPRLCRLRKRILNYRFPHEGPLASWQKPSSETTPKTPETPTTSTTPATPVTPVTPATTTTTAKPDDKKKTDGDRFLLCALFPELPLCRTLYGSSSLV